MLSLRQQPKIGLEAAKRINKKQQKTKYNYPEKFPSKCFEKLMDDMHS